MGSLAWGRGPRSHALQDSAAQRNRVEKVVILPECRTLVEMIRHAESSQISFQSFVELTIDSAAVRPTGEPESQLTDPPVQIPRRSRIAGQPHRAVPAGLDD